MLLTGVYGIALIVKLTGVYGIALILRLTGVCGIALILRLTGVYGIALIAFVHDLSHVHPSFRRWHLQMKISVTSEILHISVRSEA